MSDVATSAQAAGPIPAQNPVQNPARTPAGIRDWLTERIGYYLQCPASEIDTQVPLTDYGLDSVYAFALCGDIEDFLQISVNPTLVWDVNTVDALTRYLCDRVTAM